MAAIEETTRESMLKTEGARTACLICTKVCTNNLTTPTWQQCEGKTPGE